LWNVILVVSAVSHPHKEDGVPVLVETTLLYANVLSHICTPTFPLSEAGSPMNSLVYIITFFFLYI